MNSGQMGDAIIDFSEWLKTPLGQYVMAWEQAQFDSLVTDIFGYHAIQLGLLQVSALRTSRMPIRLTATGLSEAQVLETIGLKTNQGAGDTVGGNDQTRLVRPSVLTQVEELPFATQSIDLLVMPHLLEFSRNPHQILREAERVLIPEGQLIISGFNPISLWGVRQSLGRRMDRHFLPKQGQFLALPRLKDWLKLLSFEVNRGRYGCYCPPLRSEKWLARYGFMEKAGDRWWPICGAVYMISAVKRVRGMHLIGASWKESRSSVLGLKPAIAPSVSNRTDQKES